MAGRKSPYKSKDANAVAAHNKAHSKYVAEKLKRIEVAYTLAEFEEKIRPAIEKAGVPTATFIKKAIAEKIERMD